MLAKLRFETKGYKRRNCIDINENGIFFDDQTLELRGKGEKYKYGQPYLTRTPISNHNINACIFVNENEVFVNES